MSKNLNVSEEPVHAGDRRRIWARFQDAAGMYVDPDAFTVSITEGGGAVTANAKADFSMDSAGQYYYDHTFTEAGRCKVVATASGNIVEVEPGFVVVEAV